jgi:xanthosine phosphorylase
MPVSMQQVMEVIHRYQPKGFSPKIGMILGSGLSSLAEQIQQPVTIPYQAIPGLQTGAVAGHASLMAMGHLNDVPVICMRGRLHLYEGTPHEAVRIFIRIMKHMGCHTLLLTGAVGSLNMEAGPGEIVMITDHINFQPGNPLVGHNDESEGPRFFGMEDAYNLGMQDVMMAAANKLDIRLHKGVYLATMGPNFETPAEIRAFKLLGADVVGMSVVPEVLVARHCGLKVVGLAAVTNFAAGMSNEKITHDGTLHFGELAARKLTKLVPEFVKGAANAVV